MVMWLMKMEPTTLGGILQLTNPWGNSTAETIWACVLNISNFQLTFHFLWRVKINSDNHCIWSSDQTRRRNIGQPVAWADRQTGDRRCESRTAAENAALHGRGASGLSHRGHANSRYPDFGGDEEKSAKVRKICELKSYFLWIKKKSAMWCYQHCPEKWKASKMRGLFWNLYKDRQGFHSVRREGAKNLFAGLFTPAFRCWRFFFAFLLNPHCGTDFQSHWLDLNRRFGNRTISGCIPIYEINIQLAFRREIIYDFIDLC